MKKKPRKKKQTFKPPPNHRSIYPRKCGKCGKKMARTVYDHARLQVIHCWPCDKLTLVLGKEGQALMEID